MPRKASNSVIIDGRQLFICINCNKPFLRLSRRKLCQDCGIQRSISQIKSISDKNSPYYKDWKRKHDLGVKEYNELRQTARADNNA